ncbi:DUF3253 domain-containing protein [Luteococcus sediminum]
MSLSRPSNAQLAQEILELLQRRRPDATICPSEVARQHGEQWRELMPRVREAASLLGRDGRVVSTRKGIVVEAQDPGGPIRLGRGPRFPAG